MSIRQGAFIGEERLIHAQMLKGGRLLDKRRLFVESGFLLDHLQYYQFCVLKRQRPCTYFTNSHFNSILSS